MLALFTIKKLVYTFFAFLVVLVSFFYVRIYQRIVACVLAVPVIQLLETQPHVTMPPS